MPPGLGISTGVLKGWTLPEQQINIAVVRTRSDSGRDDGLFCAIVATTLGMAVMPLGAVGENPSAASNTISAPLLADLFSAGTDGYHTYRIPSVIVTAKGSVLAFCEGRKNGAGDAGDIDLLMKRSVDGGGTFGGQQLIWDEGANSCGNPCPVIDQSTGTIWLLMTHNLGHDRESAIVARTSEGGRTVWITRSTDDGLTWARPVQITDAVKRPQWTWYATGPGAGIQLRSGRLVIPCDHFSDDHFSHVIFSDDHGASWQIGGVAGPGGNECEVVELSDGRLLLNMRNYRPQKSSRAIAISEDQGETWSALALDPVLIEPTCQASIRRYSAGASGKNRILFSNPASNRARENLTIRLSTDDCQSWAESKLLQGGPSAYSCLAVLANGSILCFYERGEKHPYEKLTMARFTLEWLTDGRDRP